MTDADSSPTSPKTSRRLALAAILVLTLGVATIGFLALRKDGTQVRYEVETGSGRTMMVVYTTADDIGLGTYRSDVPGETVSTPWSTTVTFAQPTSLISVSTDAAESSDIATCRIFVDGEKVAETNGIGGTNCEARIP
ncbi:hypothetical protein [Actinoplanes sp. DH11]|uniref:hypothetical protein n=1 Tax=Actinoplanes sp. DH11 TaxID=2857011 RepID=UPI001E577A72|nr:hypothetical protein [Actinoplanes sp. DH11]